MVGTHKAMEGLPEDLHRADSAVAFASEVVRILNDLKPALTCAANGLAAIRRRHTWRHSLKEVKHLWEDTIAAAGLAARSLLFHRPADMEGPVKR